MRRGKVCIEFHRLLWGSRGGGSCSREVRMFGRGKYRQHVFLLAMHVRACMCIPLTTTTLVSSYVETWIGMRVCFPGYITIYSRGITGCRISLFSAWMGWQCCFTIAMRVICALMIQFPIYISFNNEFEESFQVLVSLKIVNKSGFRNMFFWNMFDKSKRNVT